MINNELIHTVIAQYAQPLNGRHGLSHWARVLENGRRLTPLTGAKIQIVELFAVFHDSKRINESIDDGHGLRGAEYAKSLRGPHLNLSDKDFDLLYTACAYHTDGLTEEDITVQTCWDTDRLDLGRINIKPDTQYLCTEAAKTASTITWANNRAQVLHLPSLVLDEWGYDIE